MAFTVAPSSSSATAISATSYSRSSELKGSFFFSSQFWCRILSFLFSTFCWLWVDFGFQLLKLVPSVCWIVRRPLTSPNGVFRWSLNGMTPLSLLRQLSLSLVSFICSIKNSSLYLIRLIWCFTWKKGDLIERWIFCWNLQRWRRK